MTILIKFILGWVMWIVLVFYSTVFSLLLWNWKETYTLDMGVVISELLGQSTWNVMTFKKINEK